MYQRYKERFGTVGVVLAIVALVLALGGTALAASKLTGPQKKEVAKIAAKEAKKYANSNPGAPGGNGKDGANGTNGTNGTDGADGASVTSAAATAAECSGVAGGVKYTLDSTTTKICNGKNGEDGEDGETGFTETLPPGMTETGTFAGAGSEFTEFFTTQIPISFPIPLEKQGNAFFLNQSETGTSNDDPNGCTGSVQAPTAPEGVLCIYTAEEGGENFLEVAIRFNLTEGKYLPTGTVLQLTLGEQPNFFNINGSWAVTAPEPAA